MTAPSDPSTRRLLHDGPPVPLAVIHLPHASREIPADLRPTLLLDDVALERELDCMTDHYTDELFAVPATVAATVRFPVSRFVVDPERFEDDAEEPMAQRGQGVVYTLTSHGRPLRKTTTPDEREALLQRFYRPHHAQLDKLAAAALEAHGTVLVIDGHSFPDWPLPMEFDQNPDRPDICLGTDSVHTPVPLVKALVAVCRALGWSAQIDAPYTGTMVPRRFFRREPRVRSILIEVNRRLYLANAGGDIQRSPAFAKVREGVQRLIQTAVDTTRGRFNSSEA